MANLIATRRLSQPGEGTREVSWIEPGEEFTPHTKAAEERFLRIGAAEPKPAAKAKPKPAAKK